jgi:peptidoglycan/LPS O-acetylase OafA/YrhL
MTGLEWLRAPIGRNNNFDLIRLLAAIQVVLGHAAGHMGGTQPTWWLHLISLFPGVPIFFFLSGLLVTSSLASSKSVYLFYFKRARRVFPALWVGFFLAVLILVLFHHLTAAEIRTPFFWSWAFTQLTVLQFYNPAMFRSFGTGVVNGSLWTISVEIGFYLILPLLVGLSRSSNGQVRNRQNMLRRLVLLSVAMSYFVYCVIYSTGAMSGVTNKAPMWARLINQTFVPHFWLFGLGILAYLSYDQLKRFCEGRAWLFLAVYIAVFYPVAAFGQLTAIPVLLVSRILLSLTIFALGVSTKSVSSRLLRGWDLSYGLYVFHMLVMNVFIQLGWTGSWSMILSVLGISLIIAALSWRFVESPSLSMPFPFDNRFDRKQSAAVFDSPRNHVISLSSVSGTAIPQASSSAATHHSPYAE